MFRKLAVAAIALGALGLAAGPGQAQDKIKACFIYVGPHNDGGYSEMHDVARQQLEAALGDKVETTYLENVPEGPDAERALERLARSGCGIIFSTSFGFMDATMKVAAQFPDIKFEHATGFKRADNVSTYNIRWYEGRYIMGQIAASVSKSGIAGYIVSFPIPEVIMNINAFMLGAQSVNPDFKVKIIWVNSWFDPGKEADAAKALIDQGADVLVQHTDSPAPTQIAEERGVHSFGQSTDMIKYGPDAQMTALVDNWGPYYIERTQAALDGTWTSTDTWAGLKADLLVMAPYLNMPDNVKAMAMDSEARIESGALVPFTGPIFKQDGTPVIGAGEHLDDAALLSMNWYVKGIDDTLPQ